MSIRPLTIITGANRGLGYELARVLFQNHDHDVLLTARDASKAQQAASTILGSRASSSSLKTATLDVSSTKDMSRFFRDELEPVLNAEENKDRQITLVNNAGIYTAPWRETLVTNTCGPITLSRLFLNHFEGNKQQQPRVVTLTSGLGNAECVSEVVLKRMADQPPKTPEEIAKWAREWNETDCGDCTGYNLSKHFVDYATELFAEAGRPHGVSFIAVDPGWVQTDMGGKNAHLTIEQGVARITQQVVIDDKVAMDRSGKVFGQEASVAIPWKTPRQ
ncbi:hypothetical protein PhCBS80983_g04794 [Powellomyces hirtus]|uniref:Uncharacterized protein n=1 Tax=Powellomyces hirtus TaxID=109895 RepID=A0A507DXM5_9FUNG|nr:hypothetical protein PhCBS80983_g04794 [Powellomyces hirtus]